MTLQLYRAGQAADVALATAADADDGNIDSLVGAAGRLTCSAPSVTFSRPAVAALAANRAVPRMN